MNIMAFILMAVGLPVLGMSVHAQADTDGNNHNCIDSSVELLCHRGCVPGFYGTICNETCSSNCHGACSQNTGKCLTGCNSNWFKSNCTRKCIGYCRADTCDVRSGECIFGCERGFHGTACDRTCSENCTGGVCDEFGGCRCKKGAEDKACYLDCSVNCLHGECGITDQGQLECLKGCQPGRTGPFCQDWCPGDCLQCDSDDTCMDKRTFSNRHERDLQNHCIQDETGGCRCCIDGWTGNECNTLCPNCIYRYRNPTCLSSCKDGYHGDECHLNCSHTCSRGQNGNNVCRKESGKCHSGCLQGYHGFTCRDQCSMACFKRECYPHNGRCVECEPKKYGDKCEDDCGHCIGGNCGRNGTCDCKPGYYGLRCKDKCSDKCKINDCRIDIRGNHLCIGQCVEGFTGDDCLSKCPSGCQQGCHRKTGSCHFRDGDGGGDGNKTLIYVLIAVVLVVAVTAVTALVFALRKSRNWRCRWNEFRHKRTTKPVEEEDENKERLMHEDETSKPVEEKNENKECLVHVDGAPKKPTPDCTTSAIPERDEESEGGDQHAGHQESEFQKLH